MAGTGVSRSRLEPAGSGVARSRSSVFSRLSSSSQPTASATAAAAAIPPPHSHPDGPAPAPASAAAPPIPPYGNPQWERDEYGGMVYRLRPEEVLQQYHQLARHDSPAQSVPPAPMFYPPAHNSGAELPWMTQQAAALLPTRTATTTSRTADFYDNTPSPSLSPARRVFAAETWPDTREAQGGTYKADLVWASSVIDATTAAVHQALVHEPDEELDTWPAMGDGSVASQPPPWFNDRRFATREPGGASGLEARPELSARSATSGSPGIAATKKAPATTVWDHRTTYAATVLAKPPSAAATLAAATAPGTSSSSMAARLDSQQPAKGPSSSRHDPLPWAANKSAGSFVGAAKPTSSIPPAGTSVHNRLETAASRQEASRVARADVKRRLSGTDQHQQQKKNSSPSPSKKKKQQQQQHKKQQQQHEQSALNAQHMTTRQVAEQIDSLQQQIAVQSHERQADSVATLVQKVQQLQELIQQHLSAEKSSGPGRPSQLQPKKGSSPATQVPSALPAQTPAAAAAAQAAGRAPIAASPSPVLIPAKPVSLPALSDLPILTPAGREGLRPTRLAETPQEPSSASSTGSMRQESGYGSDLAPFSDTKRSIPDSARSSASNAIHVRGSGAKQTAAAGAAAAAATDSPPSGSGMGSPLSLAFSPVSWMNDDGQQEESSEAPPQFVNTAAAASRQQRAAQMDSAPLLSTATDQHDPRQQLQPGAILAPTPRASSGTLTGFSLAPDHPEVQALHGSTALPPQQQPPPPPPSSTQQTLMLQASATPAPGTSSAFVSANEQLAKEGQVSGPRKASVLLRLGPRADSQQPVAVWESDQPLPMPAPITADEESSSRTVANFAELPRLLPDEEWRAMTKTERRKYRRQLERSQQARQEATEISNGQQPGSSNLGELDRYLSATTPVQPGRPLSEAMRARIKPVVSSTPPRPDDVDYAGGQPPTGVIRVAEEPTRMAATDKPVSDKFGLAVGGEKEQTGTGSNTCAGYRQEFLRHSTTSTKSGESEPPVATKPLVPNTGGGLSRISHGSGTVAASSSIQNKAMGSLAHQSAAKLDRPAGSTLEEAAEQHQRIEGNRSASAAQCVAPLQGSDAGEPKSQPQSSLVAAESQVVAPGQSTMASPAAAESTAVTHAPDIKSPVSALDPTPHQDPQLATTSQSATATASMAKTSGTHEHHSDTCFLVGGLTPPEPSHRRRRNSRFGPPAVDSATLDRIVAAATQLFEKRSPKSTNASTLPDTDSTQLKSVNVAEQARLSPASADGVTASLLVDKQLKGNETRVVAVATKASGPLPAGSTLATSTANAALTSVRSAPSEVAAPAASVLREGEEATTVAQHRREPSDAQDRPSTVMADEDAMSFFSPSSPSSCCSADAEVESFKEMNNGGPDDDNERPVNASPASHISDAVVVKNGGLAAEEELIRAATSVEHLLTARLAESWFRQGDALAGQQIVEAIAGELPAKRVRLDSTSRWPLLDLVALHRPSSAALQWLLSSAGVDSDPTPDDAENAVDIAFYQKQTGPYDALEILHSIDFQYEHRCPRLPWHAQWFQPRSHLAMSRLVLGSSS